MFLNKRQSPTHAGICDFNTFYLPEHNAHINTRNYLLAKPPMSYQDLRLVVTNRIPSNLLILPKTSIHTPIIKQQQKREYKKPYKQSSLDVYRTLPRSISYCSINFERNISNNDLIPLTNSLAIDRIPPLSNTGFFRSENLPQILDHYQKLDDKIKTNREHTEYTRSTTTTETLRRTTSTNQCYEENNDKIAPTTTRVLSCMPKNRSRKQLHVYMPAINC